MVALETSSVVLNNLYQEFFREREALRLKAFSWIPAGGAWLLDVGCKEGTVTALYRNKALNCCGVDTDYQALLNGKKSFPNINFVLADAGNLPFKAQSFDSVISTEMLQYLSKPESFFEELARLLKRNGKTSPTVIISVPNKGFLSEIFNRDQFQSWWLNRKTKDIRTNYSHKKKTTRHYSIEQIESFVNKWGVVKKFYRGGTCLHSFFPFLMESVINKVKLAELLPEKTEGDWITMKKAGKILLNRHAPFIIRILQRLMIGDFHITLGKHSYVLIVRVENKFT